MNILQADELSFHFTLTVNLFRHILMFILPSASDDCLTVNYGLQMRYTGQGLGPSNFVIIGAFSCYIRGS